MAQLSIYMLLLRALRPGISCQAPSCSMPSWPSLNLADSRAASSKMWNPLATGKGDSLAIVTCSRNGAAPFAEDALAGPRYREAVNPYPFVALGELGKAETFPGACCFSSSYNPGDPDRAESARERHLKQDARRSPGRTPD